jgi:hypothetical protein
MKRLWAIAAVLCLAAAPSRAASPNPKDLAIPQAEMSRARLLIQQLGSEGFKEREASQDALAKMGRLARPALSEALATDPNPEIRSRISRLLPKAEAADLQARIDTFLADIDGKFNHDLPGMKLFRKELITKEAGSDKAARDFYVEAMKTPAHLEMLTALDLGGDAAGRAIADRRIELYRMQYPNQFGRIPGPSAAPRPPSLIDIAMLLLAETAIDSKDIPRNNNFGVTGAYFLQVNTVIQNAANNPDGTPHGKIARQILVKWLDSRVTAEELTNVAWVANNLRGVKESGALLHRIIKTDGVAGYAKAQAMIFLLQRGKEELPTIRGQLKNETSLNNGKIQIAPGVLIDTQVRDVALALVLHTDGQDLRKFGFEFQPGFNMAAIAQNYWGYGFKSDEDRAKAYKLFEAYEAKKKTEPKKDEPKK